MDLGSDAWLIIAFVLPLLAIVVVLLIQRAKPSKNVSIAISLIAFALLAAYVIWNLFFRH